MKDNIIRVTLGSPDVTIWADYRYQYDYGQILKFDGAELPFAYQVDFSNTPVRGEAKSSIGDADGVEIPDEYFLSGENIYAWVFLHTGLDDGETVWSVVIPIKKKSKPKNAAPTPVQQSVIDQTIAALNESVEEAEEARQAIEDMTVSAETLPEGSSATVTKTVEDGVVNLDFGIPKGDTGDRGETGVTPDFSIGDVSTLPAGSSATASITGTTEAPVLNLGIPQGQRGEKGAPGQTGPIGATPNLTIGTVSTLPAGSYATATITGTPENPVLSLGIPKGDTGDVSQADLATALLEKADVITDTASGSIVSISDGMASPVLGLDVEIEPIQDLHGYANPWPTGGGKNLYNSETFPSTTINGVTCTNNGDGSFTLNGTAPADTFFNIFNSQFNANPLPSAEYRLTGCPSEAGSSAFYFYTTPAYGGDRGNGQTFTNTITGGSIYIKSETTVNNVTIWPMIRLASNGDDTFAPYSNICPISGRSEVSIKRTGTNISGATIRQHNANNIFTTGTLLKAGTYTASFSWSGTFDGMYIRTADDITSPHIAVKYNANAVTFTIDKAETIYVQGLKNGGVTATDVSFQLEPGSNASAYKPYTGEAYTIQLGQTVYGCLLYATQGKLKIETAFYSFNGTESGWRKSGSYPGSFYINTGVSHIFPSDKAICSHAANNNAFPAGYEYGMFGLDGGNKVNINVFVQQPGTTLEQFKTWLAGQYANGTPLTFVLEIASPVEIDLTPPEIDLLFGDNNVWSDTGNTDVTYRADTKLWILKKIAQALNA